MKSEKSKEGGSVPEPVSVIKAAEVGAKIVEAMPDDVKSKMLVPAAEEVGKTLRTVARAVNIALTPLRLVVWGYDKIEDFVTRDVTDKLKDVPPDQIITPAPNVAGPALESLRYTGEIPELRELYASLLATAMTASRAKYAHPAFVEIVRQLTPEESRMLRVLPTRSAFPLLHLDVSAGPGKGSVSMLRNISMLDLLSGFNDLPRASAFIDNLVRLGLAEIPWGLTLTDPATYVELEQRHDVVVRKGFFEREHKATVEFKHAIMRISELGAVFGLACGFIEGQPLQLSATEREPPTFG